MTMAREQAVRVTFEIMSLAHCSLIECDYYVDDEHTLDYVRRAVVEQLKRDGYDIASGFDKKTGKPITPLTPITSAERSSPPVPPPPHDD